MNAMNDTPLPKQERLIKLLRMTTSPNDGEALTALRMATKLLDEAGWTWERLVKGGITVVEDPFNKLGDFPDYNNRPHATPAPTSPPHRPSAPRPPPSTPQPPPRPITPTYPLGKFANKFAGHCYCCGTEVVTGKGFIFKPGEHCLFASMEWKIACTSCNPSARVWDRATPPIRVPRKKSITDLI